MRFFSSICLVLWCSLGLAASSDQKESFDHFESLSTNTSVNKARLPSQFDWRNVNGVNYLPPSRDQGDCGGCVSFAAIAAMEAQINIARGGSPLPWSLSPQHLISCGAKTCQGWHIDQAPIFLRDIGVAEDSCMPYVSGASSVVPDCNFSCSQPDKVVKIANFVQPTDGIIDIDTIKTELLKGPLLTSMILFDDLYAYKEGVYRHTSGRQLGSHAVVIVGWDDSTTSWILANSFGPEWGEQGFFNAAWDDVSLIGRYTWRFDVNADNPLKFVRAENLKNSEVLKGTIPLHLESTYPGTSRIEWLVSKTMDDLASGNFILQKTSETFDTSELPDGGYVFSVRAFHESGVADGPAVQIHVVNGPVTGSIAIENLTPGQNISSLKKIRIKSTASPILFNSIVLKIKNLQSGQTWERSTNNVSEQMLFTLATHAYPNGPYEIELVGQVGDISQISAPPIAISFSN